MVRVIRELVPAWKRTEHKIDLTTGQVRTSGEANSIFKAVIGDEPYESF